MAMNDAFEMVKDKIVWDRETVYEAASRCYMRVAAVAYPLEGSEKPFSGVLVFDTPVSDGCRLGIVFDKEKGLGFLPVNKSELDRFEKERISAVISERENLKGQGKPAWKPDFQASMKKVSPELLFEGTVPGRVRTKPEALHRLW